ncbi:MAG: CHAD domain-containing protein [Candidatus Competibacteraceae bacterium]|jgi:CHAD domain-containing protein|nr:CHAD domain-containing protein [Candidatus Competibacteraceae bacterium]
MTTELRLLLNPADAERLMKLPLLADASADHEYRVSCYYDTADGYLRQNGYQLSTHWTRGRWAQLLQNSREAEEESVTHDIDSDEINYAHLPVNGKSGRRFANLVAKQDLERLSRVELQRTLWTVQLTSETQVAITLDHGEINALNQRMPICELKLALITGTLQDVYAWVLKHTEDYSLSWALGELTPGDYPLLAAEPVTHHKARPLALAKACNSEEAFVAIIQACLAHAQLNLDAVKAGQDEGVHQMRVAFRRLRSCLKTFRPLIPKETSLSLVKELQWLNEALGPARDWDVFLHDTLLPILERFPNKRSLSLLTRRVETIRSKCYRTLKQSLADPRYQRLILRLHGWLDCREWREDLSPELAQPAVEFATAQLKRNHRRVVNRGRRFAELSIEERHQLRIRIKELRYTTEFFASLFSGSSTLDYAKSAAKLQDCLGALNDLSVAEHLLNSLNIRSASTARSLIEGWYACQAASQEQDFAASWEAFLACDRPWKKRS